MKNSIFFYFFFLSLSANAQFWQRISDFPSSERDDGVSFVIDNVAYCGTGLNAGFSACADFYALNMETDNWSTISSLPIFEERQYAVGFAFQNDGYLLGGINNSTNLNDIWKYSPELNEWAFIDTFPFSARNGASCFVLDSIAYIIGGRTSSNLAINEVWAYNIFQNTWQQKNNLPFGNRWRASACAIGEKGYLLFGKNNEDKFCNDVFEYSVLLDSWNLISNFPEPSMAYVAVQPINNNLVVIGGLDSLGNSSNKMMQYKIAEDNWQELESIPSLGRRGGMCFSNETSIYYVAGINQNNVRLKETWKSMNPTTIGITNQQNKSLIYPNPLSSAENINVNLPINKINSVQLFNLNGTLIEEVEINQKGNSILNFTWKSNLTAGLYYLKISGFNFIKTERLMIID